MLIGVNFDGIKISDRQNRQREVTPPVNYISDSFKIFAENGLNCIRVPFYWESFEKDPDGFIQEIEIISEEADKNNLMCIYDNHQWECSSFLGQGVGFPNSLLSSLFKRNSSIDGSWSHPRKKELEIFWNRWWDRKTLNSENKDGWELQKDLILIVIDKINDKRSTYGFEILNEPQIFRSSDFRKVSNYHNFMIQNIVKHTEKPIFFSYVYSNSISSLGFPWRQSKIKPTIETRNQIIFDIHPYPPYYVVLLYYKLVSLFMKNNRIFAGEFNSGVKENVTISQTQHSQYIKRFFEFSMYGATFWWWSFEPDIKHPAFNLTKVVDSRIYPNKSFENLCRSIKSNLKYQ